MMNKLKKKNKETKHENNLRKKINEKAIRYVHVESCLLAERHEQLLELCQMYGKKMKQNH